MVRDAAADLFDICVLFSSDADFITAIEAVRSMGKIVWVFGYGDAIGRSSKLNYVPDKFVDMTRHVIAECTMAEERNSREKLKEGSRTQGA